MTNQCCICLKAVPSYHNPDPVREGNQDCCDHCNRLVIEARLKMPAHPKEAMEAYIKRLRSMSFEALTEEFGAEAFPDQ